MVTRLVISSIFAVTVVVRAASPEAVTVDGSSSVYPITRAAAEAFTQKTGIPVNVSFSGTRGGFRKFVEGQIDIVGASRPILAGEIEAARKNAVEFVEVPVAYDALAIVVNPKNTWATDIKVSELKRAWEKAAQGKKTLWSDLREGWPEEPVFLLGAGADSGTYQYFAEVITGDTEGLRSDYAGSEDDEVIVRGVSQFPNALGFLPHFYVEEHPYDVKPVAVAWDVDPRTGLKPGGKPVMPDNRALLEGFYIPLGRPLFIYINKNSLEKKPAVSQFVQYMLNEGRRHIRESGYLPLNEPAYKSLSKEVEEMDTGTRFGGEIPANVPIYDILTLESK
jgi:phosphate transport system substrate-binding protein